MSRTVLSAAAAVTLSLGAGCNDAGGPQAAPTSPSVTNLGLASSPGELAGQGELWLVAAREFDGGRDLDQDGDRFDRVVHVQDLASGTVRNTGLALETRGLAPILAVGAHLAIFAASEPGTGNADLNGDGDASDAVLYVFDRATGSTHGLAQALSLLSLPSVEGDLVAFVVSEAAQGNTDLDGDGSSAGNVLHTYDAVRRELVNTHLAVASPVFLGDGRVAYFAAESSADLNGDGDALDRAVLQVFDPAGATSANTGLATTGLPPLHAAGAWLVSVSELDQGADLNGDGDLADLVQVVYDARSGVARVLGLASGLPGAAIVSTTPAGLERFGLLVPELGGVDLNGDGDLFDQVAELYGPSADVLTNTGFAATRIVFAGEQLAFLALEAGQGGAAGPATDLNGDADTLDAVACLLDPVSGKVTNLGQDAFDLVGADELLLLLRPESGSGVDWNLDGDLDDVVVHAFDRLAGTTTNTAIASAGAFGATQNEVLLYADEAGERRDLDGDGDRLDTVFVRYDLTHRRSASSGLAGSGASGFAVLASSGDFVLLANEAAQGRDLDGDGDLFDEVFHRAE